MKKLKMKKKIAKALFNDKERAVIMNSLYYSIHKYKQHGDTDNAVFVQSVAKHVGEVFDVQNQKYTKAEVDVIVGNALNEAKQKFMKILEDEADSQFKKGYEKAMRQLNTGVYVAAIHNNEEPRNEAPSNEGENKKSEE